MAVMDEFKEQREAMKHGTPKEKLSYFWYYYKWHVIVTATVLIMIVSFVAEQVNKKDPALYAIFLNSWANNELSESYIDGFEKQQDIDTSKYEVSVDTSMFISQNATDESTYASVQKLMVFIAAQQVDVLASDVTTMYTYAYQDNLADLREILDEEEYAKYEDRFFYIDGKVKDQIEEANSSLDSDFTVEYPDPTDPDSMDDPIPVAIYLNDAPNLSQVYSFQEEDAVMGVVVNSTHPKLAVKFIDYVFDGGNIQDSTTGE